MSYYVGAVCYRCGAPLEGNWYAPCPHCAKDGVNVNWKTLYDVKGKKLPPKESRWPGIFRYRDFYPLKDSDPIISLGEGNTPLLHAERMGRIVGTDHLFIKDEGKNPCLSQKDRLCALQVSKALAENAPGVVVSSTGSQGASTAAYASAAGIPCVIFTVANVSDEMKAIMRAYGGQPFVVPTMADRLKIMQKLVRDYNFYPCSGMPKPPIGSSCYGMDGYKSIAFELYEQFKGKMPDWIVFPISYGGTLHGVFQGLKDLKEMGYIEKFPRLAAAEVYGSAAHSIEAGTPVPIQQKTHPTVLTSMATDLVAYHTIQDIKDTNGVASCVSDEDTLEMQRNFAQKEGNFCEPSSAAGFVVIRDLLKAGIMKPNEVIVNVITSSGLKDLSTASKWMPPVPSIQPDIDEFRKAYEECYGKVL